jgi:hypothetical protein
MAIQWVGRDIVCLSTDTKPTNVPVNTKAFETNTGATYRFNGSAWIIESGGGGGGGGFSAGGAIFKSGNGTTTVFTIAHGLTSTPDVYFALPTNTAARGDISYSVDATNITLTYPIAPASGTNNLSYVWGAGYTNVALSTFTASSATTLTNKSIGDSLKFAEISTPANQSNTDDILLYDKEIDANNNALFAKYKEAGSIVEVRIF